MRDDLDSRAWQAGAIWEQRDDRYAITLIGPLGQGRADVRGAPDGVTLRVDGDVYRAADADQLIHSALGLRLPVAGLRYWLLGVADPARPAETLRDVDGRTLQLRQDGWRIDYPNWLDVDGYRLPARLRAYRDALDVTVVVKQWILPPAR